MMTTPTAALVEEAETVADGMTARIRDLVCIVENYDPEEEREDDRCPECKSPLGAPDEPGMEPTPFCNACAHGVVEELALAVQQLRQTVRRAEAERDELRATVTRLNRRAQTAEAGVRDNVEACKAAGVSMGRTLANAAADMYLRRAEQAEAERDAQHALVLRLTAESEEARLRLKTSEEGLRVVTMERDHAQQVEAPDAFLQRDEARAQVWGLICAGSNMAERRRYFQGLWETALEAGLKLERRVSELTATRDLLLTENAQLQQMLSRPDPVVHETPVDGVVPCCGQKLHDLKDGSRVNEGPLVNCDRMRLLSRVGELGSANLLLTAENERLRAQVATLELLRRGGK